MQPAAVLAVVVKAQGVGPTNAELRTVQATLEKTDAAGMRLGKGMVASGALMTKAGKTMTKAATIPLLAIGAAAVDVELKFGRSMSLIRTQAGASAKETHYLKKEVLGLSEASKFGPDEVANALFRVRSAGFKGAKAMVVMREGVKLATVGNSDLEMTTKALTGAAKSLDIHGSKAMNHLAAEMNATVGTGDMRMEELQSALSTGVLPAFVSAGMGMRDYASALTVMTDRNVPAQVASTRLRTAITMLIPHTKKAEEALGSVGIKAEAMAHIMRSKGLPDAIAYLAKHLDQLSKNKANRIEIEAFGGAKSSATIQTLIENYKELFLKQKLVGEGIGKYGKEVKVAEHNPLVELQKAWANIQVDLVRIGEVLVPIVVPAFLKVAHVINNVVGEFSHLSPGSQKAVIYFAMVVAAVGPLLRLFGWLTTKTGKLIMWLERNNAVLGETTAASEAASEANTALAASYEEVAAAAEAAGTAQQMAAIKTDAAQMQMAIPEEANAAGQMSLLATPARATATEASGAASEAAIGAEGAAAGGTAARGFAGGLAAMLPAALAAVGVVNILSSVMGGDTKGALFKTGGAAAGAIAGGLIGGLPGALIGGGLGSVLGGVIGHMFGGKALAPIQETVQKQAAHAKDAINSQRKALGNLHEAEGNLNSAKKRSVETSKRVQEAHAKENKAVHEFGPASRQARQAMHELTSLEHKNAMAAKGVENAHRLSGHALKLYRHETVLAVASEKARLPSLRQQIKQMNKKYSTEEDNWKLLHRLVGKEKVEGKIRSKIQEQVAEAAQVGGHKFAKSLRNLSAEQANLGRDFHGITIGARHVKESLEDFATRGAIANKHFIKSSYQAQFNFHEDAKKISEATGIAVGKIETRLAGALEKMGVAAVGFGTKNKGGKEHSKNKRQAGGVVVPGSGSGDKVPVQAMVEPGEVLHVLNRNSAAFHGLTKMNNSIPRFQKGGHTGFGGEVVVGGSNMSVGDEPQILSDLRALSAELHKVVYVISGYRTPQHSVEVGGFPNDPHTRGEAADIGVGSGLRDSMFSVSEAALHKVGLYRPFYPPDPNEVNHVQLFGKQMAGMLAAAQALPKIQGVEVTGPDGSLKKMGNIAADATYGAAEKYLKAHAPKGGGGGVNGVSLKGVSGSVASQAAQIAKRAKASFIPTLALFEALWAESSMGAAAPGNVLEALEPFTKIRPAAQEISGFLTGVPTWTGTNAISEHNKNPELPANAIAQLVQKSGVGEGNEGRANYLQQRSAALSTMAQFGLSHGADGGGGGGGGGKEKLMAKAADAGKHFLKATGKKKGPGHNDFGLIAKGIKNITHGVKSGKHEPKYKAALKKIRRRIEGVGLSGGQIDAMSTLTKEAERYSEWAGNAQSLTTEKEENEIPGVFRGGTEGEWLQKQLTSLLAMRREVIKAHGLIEHKYQPHIHKLLENAKKQLQAVRAAIRKAEREKEEMEAKIKEIQRGQKHNKTGIEGEVKTLEHELSKEEHQKHPNKAKMASLREAIGAKKAGISATDKSATGEVKKLNEQIREITKAQAGRNRVVNSLVGTSPAGIIPSLEGKETSLRETMAGLFGSGSEVKKKSFMGLEQIQGKGGPTDQIKGVPTIGSLGPEVLTVQQRLRELGEKTQEKKLPESNSEVEGIEKELGIELKERELVRAYQENVLRNFPTVKQINAQPYPFAGSFAKGGVAGLNQHAMAWVGEKGPEPVFAPRGSRVIPSHDAKAALRSSGTTTLVIEHLEIHPDGSATVRVDGNEFSADVKKVTKKESRGSMSRTPGGRGLKR